MAKPLLILDHGVMKKILLTALMIPCLASASNWVFVTKNKAGKSYFIDTQSIQKSGDFVTFSDKVNNASRDEFGDLSSKNNVTINCGTKELNFRYHATYSEIDNQGKPTSTFAAPDSKTWQPIDPDTENESLMKFVCKK